MSKRFKRLSHTIYECKYYIVFCQKYRDRILKNEIAEYIRQQVYNLCNQKDLVEVMELSVQEDHVHLVMSIPPKYNVDTTHKVYPKLSHVKGWPLCFHNDFTSKFTITFLKRRY